MSLELMTSRLRSVSRMYIFQRFDGSVPQPVPHRAKPRPVLNYDRPFSQHGTLDRSLFVGFNRNDVSLLHLVERGCCGYTIAEVLCAFGNLSAYVCYPHPILSFSVAPLLRRIIVRSQRTVCTHRYQMLRHSFAPTPCTSGILAETP